MPSPGRPKSDIYSETFVGASGRVLALVPDELAVAADFHGVLATCVAVV